MANDDEIARLTRAMDRVFAVLGNESPEIAAQVGFEMLRATIWCAAEGEIAETEAHTTARRRARRRWRAAAWRPRGYVAAWRRSGRL
jgi:hypothetical protein